MATIKAYIIFETTDTSMKNVKTVLFFLQWQSSYWKNVLKRNTFVCGILGLRNVVLRIKAIIYSYTLLTRRLPIWKKETDMFFSSFSDVSITVNNLRTKEYKKRYSETKICLTYRLPIPNSIYSLTMCENKQVSNDISV